MTPLAVEARSRHVLNLGFAGLVLVALVMCIVYLVWLDAWDAIGIDFRASTWEPAKALFNGQPLYQEPESIRRDSFPALYPPPYVLVFSPLSALPSPVASGIWMIVLLASTLGALWIVGLRDSRCYAVTALSLPVAAAIGAGNATSLLLLSTALLWKWRDRTHAAAATFAAGLLIKPILWPLFVWLVASRRSRLAAEASAIAFVVGLAGWAVIGFDGLAEYPELLRAQSRALGSNGLLSTNLLLDVGLGFEFAVAVSFLLGACLLLGSLRMREDLDRFALGIAAGLLMTPVMFVHYFALLFIPLAIRSPRLGPAWFVPQALWLIAFAYEGGARPLWTSLVGMSVLGSMLVALVRDPLRQGYASPSQRT